MLDRHERLKAIGFLLACAAVGIAAAVLLTSCSHDSGGDGSGVPTVASQVHFGATECVDYCGAGEPIYLNRRLGQMADGKRCELRLCFAQSAGEPECMYNCPPGLVLGCDE